MDILKRNEKEFNQRFLKSWPNIEHNMYSLEASWSFIKSVGGKKDI